MAGTKDVLIPVEWQETPLGQDPWPGVIAMALNALGDYPRYSAEVLREGWPKKISLTKVAKRIEGLQAQEVSPVQFLVTSVSLDPDDVPSADKRVAVKIRSALDRRSLVQLTVRPNEWREIIRGEDFMADLEGTKGSVLVNGYRIQEGELRLNFQDNRDGPRDEPFDKVFATLHRERGYSAIAVVYPKVFFGEFCRKK